MQFRAQLAFVLAAAAAMPKVTAAAAAPVPGARQAITRLYTRSCTSFKWRDVDALVALSTPDFTMHRPDGSSWRLAQVRVYFNLVFGALKRIDQVRFTVLKLTVNGRAATVKVKRTVIGQLGGSPNPHSLSDTSVQQDVWRLTKAGWRVAENRQLSDKLVIDGKVAGKSGGGKSIR